MSQFFTSWATWEKLVFILACAIVVTILLGCAKLGYAHWVLRKHIAVAENEKREKELQRQMSRRQQSVAGDHSDIPFGIRAIESGVEVDGVWISRKNTPEPASRHTSASSIWSQVPRKDDYINIEGQPAMHYQGRTGTTPTYEMVRPASLASEHRTSSESAPSGSLNQEQTTEETMSKPFKSRHPPSSLSRFNGYTHLSHRDSTVSTVQGIEAVFNAAGPLHKHGRYGAGDGSLGSSESSNQSSCDSTESETIAASAPGLLSQQAQSRQTSTDLDLMHNHRISQAAETGQFARRVRPGHGSEQASIADIAQPPVFSEPVDYFSQQRLGSLALAETKSPKQGPSAPLLATPDAELSPPAVQRSSLPDVTPFAKFCKTAPPSPRLEENASTSADRSHVFPAREGPYGAQSMASNLFGAQVATEPLASVLPDKSSEASHMPPRTEKGTSFDHDRMSNVMRGLGTGFEILKPGSLNPTIPAQDEARNRQSVSTSHLRSSSAGGNYFRSVSADSSRKLQKKRRPSADSKKSTDGGI